MNIYQSAAKPGTRLKESSRITAVGALLNILLSIAKIAAGIIGRSQAIVSDGIHSLSDLFSDIIVVVGSLISSKPNDSSHNYGHGKFEALCALMIGGVLGAVGFGIGYASVMEIIEILQGKSVESPGIVALAAAVVSIVTKEILFRATLKTGKKINSSVVIANAYHHRSDAFSSIGTALGVGGAIVLGEKWVILDPAAGLIVSGIIIFETLKIVRENLNELLERSLPEETAEKIITLAASVPGVYSPHNLKTRKVGCQYVIDLHIRVDAGITIEKGHEISHQVEELIRENLGNDLIFYAHIEPRTLET